MSRGSIKRATWLPVIRRSGRLKLQNLASFDSYVAIAKDVERVGIAVVTDEGVVAEVNAAGSETSRGAGGRVGLFFVVAVQRCKPPFHSVRGDTVVPLEALTEFDFAILEKVSGSESMSVEEVAAAFPNQRAVALRVRLLSSPEYNYWYDCAGRTRKMPMRDSSYLENRGGCVIVTELGLKVLEDYRLKPTIISLISLAKSYQAELRAFLQMLP